MVLSRRVESVYSVAEEWLAAAPGVFGALKGAGVGVVEAGVELGGVGEVECVAGLDVIDFPVGAVVLPGHFDVPGRFDVGFVVFDRAAQQGFGFGGAFAAGPAGEKAAQAAIDERSVLRSDVFCTVSGAVGAAALFALRRYALSALQVAKSPAAWGDMTVAARAAVEIQVRASADGVSEGAGQHCLSFGSL